MKKLLLFISIVVFIVGCSTEQQFVDSNQKRTMGDSTRNFHLKLVDSSYTFQGWEQGLGIKIPFYDNGTYRVSYSSKVFNGTAFDTVFTYNCPIFNAALKNYLGINDWVVEKALSGTPVGNSGTYNYGDIIAIYTVKNSLPVAEVIKQNFNLSATAYHGDYDPLQQINYNEGLPTNLYMFLPAGTADNYTNRAVARTGRQLVIVHLNPSGTIDPTKVSNNVVVLPVEVTINSTNPSNLGFAVIDESIRAENPTIPPSNLVVTRRTVRGKRLVKLNWDCPYHGDGVNTHYIPHTFTVKRDGVIKYSGKDISEFEDTLQGNPLSVTYTITTTVIGLGESNSITRIVSRN